VKASIVTTQCAGVANSCCTPERCPAILMTVTRWAPLSKPRRGSPAARSSDRASLCRQGIPRPRCPKSPPRVHLRPKAWGLPHQTRAQTAFRHRGGDRTYEGRRPSRPLLSQRSRRRCRQRHPQRRRLQPPPRSRLAEDDFARRSPRATSDRRNQASPQTGFLTGDALAGIRRAGCPAPCRKAPATAERVIAM
jgi:hypothetical protein